MIRSKIIACSLCLTLLASAVVAQDGQPLDSNRLKQKIEELENAAPKSGTVSVNLTYQRILSRRYEQYISSLQQDIVDLNKLLKTLDESDPNEIKEIKADIERLTKEREAAVEKARSLPGGTQESMVMQSASHTTTSQQDDAQPPAGRNAGCNTDKEKEPVGLIWCGNAEAIQHQLDVQELAERVAPILWFSPDEPLLKDVVKIPEQLPGDDGGSPVVYYRISHLVLNPSVPLSDNVVHERRLELKKIKKLTLKYYFYYSDDKGFTPHKRDLESARFEIHFTARDQGDKEIPDPNAKGAAPRYYTAHISRVVGAAHGVSWFDNILKIERHTSLPMTLFVEEGKHATGPDRNADGFYSPGYDVNRRFNDAWGVRDIIATGEVGGVHYDTSKTKPRKPKDMIMVASTIRTDELLRFYDGSEENRKMLEKNPRYKLKHLEPPLVKTLRDTVKSDPKSFDQKSLDLLEGIEKEQEKLSKTHGDDIFEKAVKYGYGIERTDDFLDALTLSYRFDGGHGFTFSPPIIRRRIPIFGGYVLPKTNVILFGNVRRYSLEALYAPSAARSFDWYASIGSEWLRPRSRDPEVKRDFDAKFVSEAGIRGRFNKGPFLIGGRLGLRTTGRDQRIVFEIGTGAF